MKLDILRCHETSEVCESAPKYRIEGQGEFCRKHGERRFFEANLPAENPTVTVPKEVTNARG